MITVITPTCDRPVGIAHLERWMARQTVQPDRWLVVDSGNEAASLTMGQDHRRMRHGKPGAENFAKNVLHGLGMVSEGIVLFMEDDDWYSPRHIEACAKALQYQPVYGCDRLWYYNIKSMAWVMWRNHGASLAQTALHATFVKDVVSAAGQALRAGDYAIDGRFWKPLVQFANGAHTSIGIKGLPGTKGLGQGHKVNHRWTRDPQGLKLREWIGDDADAYLQ